MQREMTARSKQNIARTIGSIAVIGQSARRKPTNCSSEPLTKKPKPFMIGAACLMAADLTSQWTTTDFLPSQVMQAIGQSFASPG